MLPNELQFSVVSVLESFVKGIASVPSDYQWYYDVALTCSPVSWLRSTEHMATQGNEDVLFISFNQDASSLAVGTKKAYRLYALNNVDELQKLYEQDVDDVCIVERLFSSSLVLIVSQSAPRKLRVCHFQRGVEICHHSFNNTILAVRLNRLRVIVCLEESLFIHNIRDMKVLHSIRDTPPNPQGLCELTVEENSFLAYPGSSKIGEVQIFDAANLQAVTTIVAHDSPLAAMKFSMDGTKIATASTKGTVIRVFTVTTGERLFEFRRGMKRCVSIYSLAFSHDGLYLCSSSNTETIHVFKLEHPAKDSRRHSGEVTPVTPSQPAAGASGWISSFATAATNYLPTQVTDMLGQDRAFATAKLPHPGAKNVAALTVIKDHHRLMVASTDGYLYVYKFDPVDGGECGVVKQHCVLTTKQSGQQSPSPLNSLESPTKPNSSGGGGKSPHSYAASVVKGGSEATPSASGTPPGKKSAGEADSTATFSSPLTPLDYDEFHLQREIDSSRKAKKPIPLDDVDEFPPMTHTSQP